jgi:hypothetical protein
LRAKTVLCQLLVVGLIATIFSFGSAAVAPSTAQAHDQGDCARAWSWVECLFVKHGLQYVSNKLANSQGTQYTCAHSRIAYYNSAGAMFARVVGPRTCANALQFIDRPGPYEKTHARTVCARWDITYPDRGYTPLVCLRAPW